MLVQVDVIDDEGRRCPTALDMIEFELEGPVEWSGDITQGDNHVLATSLPVECGGNRKLLRSAAQLEKTSSKARAEGLPEALLALESRLVEVIGGLSTDEP